jgi:hypothetical protein
MMIRSALATLIICLSVASLAAQKSVERWHRVYTGDDSLIEIDLDSVSFADHVIRAQFRTIYSSPATLSNNSNVKYTTRIEDLGFKIDAKQYHLYETSLLDPSGKAVNTRLRT